MTALLAAGCSSPTPVAEAPAAPKTVPWEITLAPGTLETGATSMGPQFTAAPDGAVLSWMIFIDFLSGNINVFFENERDENL